MTHFESNFRPYRCHREKARNLRNLAALLINEKEIAKHEGETNVQVL